MNLIISEVKKRTVLWNKWDPKFKDRVVVDKEWESISKVLGISREVVKKKWRSARDQFLKEFKKIPTNRSGSCQEYAALYESGKYGKWCYFRAMLFLKDTIEPRKSDGNVTDIDDNEEFEEQDDIDDIDQSSEQNINTEDSMSSPPSVSTQKKNKRLKKQGSSNNFERRLRNLETRKLAALTGVPVPTDDEDMHFFKSIHFYFKQMSPVQKLRVRNEFQNILIRESLTPQSYFGTTNAPCPSQNHILLPVSAIQQSQPIFSSMQSPLTNFHYSEYAQLN